MTITLHGIPNCDTVKKARKWLDAQGVAYDFHDYKKTPPSVNLLQSWVDAVGHEPLLNKRGTTFRKLSDADRADIDDAKAVRLMVENPSTIKRPVVTGAGDLIVGFDEAEWDKRFG